jgi:hypothetical protein
LAVRIAVEDDNDRRGAGTDWQIKLDGVLQRDLLFSSLRVAADRAKELIDQERSAD